MFENLVIHNTIKIPIRKWYPPVFHFKDTRANQISSIGFAAMSTFVKSLTTIDLQVLCESSTDNLSGAAAIIKDRTIGRIPASKIQHEPVINMEIHGRN